MSGQFLLDSSQFSRKAATIQDLGGAVIKRRLHSIFNFTSSTDTVCFRVASSPRLSEEAKRELNSLVLQEFAKRGLSINEGIEIDARLLKSASKPVSKEGLGELKEQRVIPEDKVDKNGNTLKFKGGVKSE